MARRSDHSREELHDLAMAAARAIVVRDGLQGLTARRVANAIGYSPGTLYNIFNGLDDLTVHLNGQTLDQLYGSLSSRPKTNEAFHDVRQLLVGYLEFLENNRNLWKTLFEYRLPSDQTLPPWYLEKVANLLGLIESALSPLFPSGEKSACAGAARVLWASLHGICSLSQSGKLQVVSDQDVAEMTEMLVVCFVSGLRQAHQG